MFVYQTKINGKDGLVLVSETTDEGLQIPAIGKDVLVVYEADGVLQSAKGTVAEDGTFTEADGGEESEDDDEG